MYVRVDIIWFKLVINVSVLSAFNVVIKFRELERNTNIGGYYADTNTLRTPQLFP